MEFFVLQNLKFKTMDSNLFFRIECNLSRHLFLKLIEYKIKIIHRAWCRRIRIRITVDLYAFYFIILQTVEMPMM